MFPGTAGADHLYIVLCEFLRERPPSSSHGVYSIIDRYLPIFVVQEMVDILSTFLENLLSKKHRACGRYSDLVSARVLIK